jgi:hypothetical protein
MRAGDKQSQKMATICSSETSVDFQRTTRRYFQEDGTLYNRRCQNLKSYIKFCNISYLSVRAVCSAHFIILDMIILIVFGESKDYETLDSSLFSGLVFLNTCSLCSYRKVRDL